MPEIKALWICSWYPNRVTPNLANFVFRHAKATDLFADICVINACSDASLRKGYEITVDYEPFLAVRIFYAPTRNTFLKAWRIFQAYKRGYNVICNQWGKPELTHLHTLFPAGIFGWYLYFREKMPFVITEHRAGYMHTGGSYKGFGMKLFTKLTFRWAKYAFPISNSFGESLRSHGLVTKFQVVPNVIDTGLFNLPNLSEKRTPDGKFRFLHIGALSDFQKNQSGIIKAAARLALRRKDFEVYIVGAGKDSETLIDLSKELKVWEKNIFFKGHLKEDQVVYELKQSNGLLMFSNIESQMVVVLEAMSCGLPIIATETGGINERVTEQTGILLEIGDEEGLVEAMNYMIDNNAKYDPSVIRQKIVEKCSVEAVGQAISDVYREVLTNKKH